MQRCVRILGTIACLVLATAGCGKKSTSPIAPTTTGGTPAPSVQTITIGPAATGDAAGTGISLVVGETRQLKASARLSDGSEHDITLLATWASDDANAASVSASGLVVARGAGAGRIRASYLTATGSTAFDVANATSGPDGPGAPDSGTTPDTGGTPPPPPGSPSPAPGPGVPPAPTPIVQSLTITGANTLPAGRSVQLRAIATMSDGSQKDVTGSADWGSDNLLVALITQSGLLTGLAPGSSVARASYDGKNAQKPITVTTF
jgi:trimeric autotransporter adhesin